MPVDAPPLALNAWLRWDVVNRLVGSIGADAVVEVGCGQGGFGVRLASRAGSYRGFEPDYDSFAIATERMHRMEWASVENRLLPAPDEGTADLVCAFEVLEHIEDDSEALMQWSGWVRPGGHLIVSVPAHQHRFAPWDTAVGHFRRYGRADLSGVLEAAGFEVERVTAYGFPLGYLLEAVRNRLAPDPRSETCSDRTSKSGRLLQPRRWMGGLTRLATFPFRLLQRPFQATDLGTGWVAVARRPE